MTTTDLPAHRCAHCGHVLEAMTSLYGHRRPRAGAVSVCLYCVKLNVLTEAMTLRQPTPAELDRFLADAGVRRAIAVIRASHAKLN